MDEWMDFEFCFIVTVIYKKWIDEDNNKQINPQWKYLLVAAQYKIVKVSFLHLKQLQEKSTA